MNCVGGTQSRLCEDKNNCETSKTIRGRTYPVILIGEKKPATEQTCIAAAVTPQPLKAVTSPPQPVAPREVQKPAEILPFEQPEIAPTTSFWQKSKGGIIAVIIAVIVLSIAAGVFLYVKRKKEAKAWEGITTPPLQK